LRTPLTSVKGYASLLMSGKLGEIPDGVKDRLEKINKHSDSLVKLINDLLDIARIESGRVEMKIAPHSIAATIENVRDLLTPQMKDKNIQFVADIAPNTPEVPMDASQVERVIINLVGNAVKFTRPNGTITAKTLLDANKITVMISDTGIGMKEEEMANLFNEFYRIDNEINQNVKGTGLGLALAKQIVEAHHGKMWVTSKVNEGSNFYFTLPLKPEKSAS
jgi:signal transduction histidine kinase